jgi:transposase
MRRRGRGVAAIDVATASGWSAPACRMPPRRAGASPRSGRSARPATRSWSWPGGWPARDPAGGGGVHLRRPAAVRLPAGSPRPCGVLVNAHDVRHLPGRPKTDKLDAVWPARLNERGMLRPSSVPPAEIRRSRDSTRLRADPTVDRSRHKRRLEQAAGGRPEQAFHGGHRPLWRRGRAMLAALIAGQRDPRCWPGWPGAAARQPRRPGGGPDRPLRRPPRRAGPHAAGPARHPRRADRAAHRPHRQTIGAIPAAQPRHQHRARAPAPQQAPALRPSRRGRCLATRQRQRRPPTGELLAAPLPAVDRLDEVAGIGRHAAQVIIAEVGLDMGQFPTPAHLVSWARAVTAHHPVRRHPPLGRHRQGQPRPQGHARGGRRDRPPPLGERYRRRSGASASAKPWSPWPARCW